MEPPPRTRPGGELAMFEPAVDQSPAGREALIAWQRRQRRRGLIMLGMVGGFVAVTPLLFVLPPAVAMLFGLYGFVALGCLPMSVVHLLRAAQAGRTIRALPALPDASLRR